MQATADPRPARTRRAILTAVEELLAEGNGTPSVSDIVRRAGVSRSSFYTQFEDAEHLAGELFAEAFANIDESDRELRRTDGVTSTQATHASVARVVAHVAQRREFYRVGMLATAAGCLEAVRTVAERLRESLPVVATSTAPVPFDAAALFIAGGTLTVLRSWVLGDLDATEEEVADHIYALLPAWVAEITPPPPPNS